jgi:hypothetical protein
VSFHIHCLIIGCFLKKPSSVPSKTVSIPLSEILHSVQEYLFAGKQAWFCCLPSQAEKCMLKNSHQAILPQQNARPELFFQHRLIQYYIHDNNHQKR